MSLYAFALLMGGWGVSRGHEAVVLVAMMIASSGAWHNHGEALSEGRSRRLIAFLVVPSLAAAAGGMFTASLVGASFIGAALRLALLSREALLSTTNVGTAAVRQDSEADQRMKSLIRKEDDARANLHRAVELSRALRAVLASSSADEALSSLHAAARRLEMNRESPAFVRDGDGFRANFEPAPHQEQAVKALIGQARLALLRSVRMEQLREVSRTDWLTGLPNRRALDEALPVEQRRASALGLELSYAMIDIDHFKRFNDTHGHAVGDAVLMAVAQQLRHVARKSDFVARYGGEEFALILPESSEAAAALLAERVQRYLAENPARPHGHTQTLPVTVSIGISSKGLDHADKALYVAKQNGRNRVEVA